MQLVAIITIAALLFTIVLGGILLRDILTKQQDVVDHVATTVAEAVVAGVRGTLGYDQPLIVADEGELSREEPIEPELPDIELDDLFVPGSVDEFVDNRAGWLNAKQGVGRTAGADDAGDVDAP